MRILTVLLSLLLTPALFAQEDGNRRGISPEDYQRAAAQIREAVANGQVSKEDAETRLMEMRKMVSRQKASEKSPQRGEIKRPDAPVREAMANYRRQLGTDIKNGKITREEAGSLMEQFEIRAKYRVAAGEIRTAIAEGHITEDEGKKKLAGMRARMTKSAEGAKRGVAAKSKVGTKSKLGAGRAEIKEASNKACCGGECTGACKAEKKEASKKACCGGECSGACKPLNLWKNRTNCKSSLWKRG